MSVIKYNNLLAICLMPPLPILLKILGVGNTAVWFSYPIVSFILILSILRHCVTNGVTHKQLFSISISGLAIFFIFFIETMHFFTTSKTIDDLRDVRMLIYSPLYGEMLTFTLYSLYLGIQRPEWRASNLKFIIRFTGASLLAIVLLVQAIKLDLLVMSLTNEVLKSNSTAYFALTVLTLILLFKNKFDFNPKECLAWSLVNLLIILLIMSRGALALSLILLYFFASSALQRPLNKVALNTLVVAVLGILFLEFQSQIKIIFESLVGFVTLIHFVYDIGWHSVDLLEITGLNLESPFNFLSVFSRIGTILYAGLVFLEHPLLGIGQALAYEIDILESGLHSFSFLLIAATGLLGTLAFVTIIFGIFQIYPPVEYSSETFFTLFLWICILTFLSNSMHIFLAILPGIITSSGSRHEFS